MIYLASPYTHDDPYIMELRYLQVMKVLAEQYLAKHITAYSPIVHYHVLAKIYKLPKSHEFWLAHDREMIRVSEVMHILRLEDYEKSEGLKSEIQYCTSINKRFLYV